MRNFPRILVALCLMLCACHDDDHKANGGSDGGGGVTGSSTTEEIKAATEVAFKYVIGKDFYSDLFYIGHNEYFGFEGADRNGIILAVSALEFSGIATRLEQYPYDGFLGPDGLSKKETQESLFEKYHSDLLSDHIKFEDVYFKEDGPCPAKTKLMPTRVCLNMH